MLILVLINKYIALSFQSCPWLKNTVLCNICMPSYPCIHTGTLRKGAVHWHGVDCWVHPPELLELHSVWTLLGLGFGHKEFIMRPFPPPSMLQALKNTKLAGMTETQNSLKDISTQGAHRRGIHVMYNIPGTFTMAGKAWNRKFTIGLKNWVTYWCKKIPNQIQSYCFD